MSKIVADMYEGINSKVPVGQPNFTQDGKRLKENEKPLTDGEEITNLHINQFDAFGPERQELTTKRDDHTNELDFQGQPPENDGLLEEGAFDDENGTLKFVRRNSEEFEITGFLTQSDFGVGAPGPKGPPGRPGFHGDDGFDGSPGPDGCEGDLGEVGAPGPMGATGEDGDQGVQGPPGSPGQEGVQGPDGEMGRFGNEGCLGKKGCAGTSGGAGGESGTTPNASVVISSSEPDESAYLWGVI